MTTPDTKTGLEIVAGIAASQSLDQFMRSDPASVTPDQRRLMIDALRLERAQWVLKGEKKTTKKDTENDD